MRLLNIQVRYIGLGLLGGFGGIWGLYLVREDLNSALRLFAVVLLVAVLMYGAFCRWHGIEPRHRQIWFPLAGILLSLAIATSIGFVVAPSWARLEASLIFGANFVLLAALRRIK